MNFRLYPLMTLALLTLVSCAAHQEIEHCINRIDPFDMSEETLASTCLVNVVPTTIDQSRVISDVPNITEQLATTLTEKTIDAINNVHHFTVTYPDNTETNLDTAIPTADYILTSHIDEFILTDDQFTHSGDLIKDQKQITAAVTYDLRDNATSQIVYSNTINISLVHKTYDPALLANVPALTDITQHVLNNVSRLFKHNFVNEFNPIRIIDINEEGFAIFNQPVKIGTTCYVYHPDQYDPSIIENYQDNEGAVKGIFQVTENSPAATLAATVEGIADKQDICRTKYFSNKFSWDMLIKQNQHK